MKKKAKNITPMSLLKDEVEGLDFSKVDSIVAYRTNGYKQWGRIFNEIDDSLNGKLGKVCIIRSEIAKRQAEISKVRGKDIVQLCQLLCWQIEDLQKAVGELGDEISKSGICIKYANHEAINGEDKRLGLRILQRRTALTMGILVKATTECRDVAQSYYDDYSMGYDTYSRYAMR